MQNVGPAGAIAASSVRSAGRRRGYACACGPTISSASAADVLAPAQGIVAVVAVALIERSEIQEWRGAGKPPDFADAQSGLQARWTPSSRQLVASTPRHLM